MMPSSSASSKCSASAALGLALHMRSWRTVFSPCAQEQIKALRAKQQLSANTSFGVCFVGDVSQSAERPRGGHWMPTIARSSTMVSLTANAGHGHIFTMNELDFSMGWPVLPLPMCKKYASAIPEVYKNLSSATANPTRLSGNGMMLQQIAAWNLYLWGNLVRRDVLSQWRPPLRLRHEKSAQKDAELSFGFDVSPRSDANADTCLESLQMQTPTAA